MAAFLRQTEEGCYLALKVRAGGRRNAVGGLHDGALRVEVTTAPEKGKANKAVVGLVAEFLGVAPSRIVLVSGECCANKTVFAQGLRAVDIEARLAGGCC